MNKVKEETQEEEPEEKQEEQDAERLLDLCIHSDNETNTPILMSILSDTQFEVSTLLITDTRGYTLLMLVCENKNVIVANKMLELISLHDDLEVKLMVIDEGSKDRSCALLLTCKNQMEDTAIIIFDIIKDFRPGIHITYAENSTGNNALMWSCINKMPRIAAALAETHIFDPNQSNNSGKPLIQLAYDMTDGKPNPVVDEYIVDNKWGPDFLELCKSLQQNQIKMLDFLKTDYDIRTLNTTDAETGYSPIMFICKYRITQTQYINMIFNNIAIKFAPSKAPTPTDIIIIRRIIDTVAKDGTTALIWLCKNNVEPALIQILIILYNRMYKNLNQSNIAVQDETGNNALMWACIVKNDDIANILIKTNAFYKSTVNNAGQTTSQLIADMHDPGKSNLTEQNTTQFRKQKLKRLNSHENKQHFPENGIVFYINGHSSINGHEIDSSTSSASAAVSAPINVNDMSKGYMMFLKSFGESTSMDSDFNSKIDELIDTYLKTFLTNNQNYSTLYGFLSPTFEPSKKICKPQQKINNCEHMASLLRYLPLYYKDAETYVYLPRKPARQDSPRIPGKLIRFNRSFSFNSSFNVFSLYFTRHQISDPTIHKIFDPAIPDETIDAVMDIVSLNLCEEDNNSLAIIYLCIYFIQFWQHKCKSPIRKSFEELNLWATLFVYGIEFKPDYQISPEKFNTLINTYFDKLMIDGTINGKRVSQTNKDTIISTFSTIFRLPTVCSVDPSIFYISTTDLQFVIDINNIFKCVGIGEPVIISKSCNGYRSDEAETALKPLQEYMDEFEYHPGELAAIKYTKTRKVSSLDNFDKSRSFSRKKRAEFEKDFPKKPKKITIKMMAQKLKIKKKLEQKLTQKLKAKRSSSY